MIVPRADADDRALEGLYHAAGGQAAEQRSWTRLRRGGEGDMGGPFRVGLTHDFLKPDGTIGFGDIGLRLLDVA